MVKLQESMERWSVTIPKDYIQKKKWKKGDNLIWSFNERGNLELSDTK